MNVPDFNLRSRKLFPGAPYSLDHLATVASGKPWRASFDIVKFDDWMVKRHGKYEGSMRERVAELFGEKAALFIEEVLSNNGQSGRPVNAGGRVVPALRKRISSETEVFARGYDGKRRVVHLLFKKQPRHSWTIGRVNSRGELQSGDRGAKTLRDTIAISRNILIHQGFTEIEARRK
jgi:hypothetical protein